MVLIFHLIVFTPLDKVVQSLFWKKEKSSSLISRDNPKFTFGKFLGWLEEPRALGTFCYRATVVFFSSRKEACYL